MWLRRFALVIVLVAACTSGSIAPSPSPTETTEPTPTPTPTPDPAIWRYEGVVVDEAGKPIEGVCVVIGPAGCQRFSPHTDARGSYYFDVPQNPSVVYDLTFMKEGFAPVSHRAQPSGPTVFNVVLVKAVTSP